MKETWDHKKAEERAVPSQESNNGALETNMGMEEERTIIEWINNNPLIKKSTMLEDESMLTMTDKLSAGLESAQR
eukprot:2983666-Heterocapsa_arctica.AAC.1